MVCCAKCHDPSGAGVGSGITRDGHPAQSRGAKGSRKQTIPENMANEGKRRKVLVGSTTGRKGGERDTEREREK